jgi:hypothetical protein
MGHRQGDSGVYVEYYMSTFNDVDCQSICFGSAPQHDLIHLAGRLIRHSNAPTALTAEQRLEVRTDPELVDLCLKRSEALAEIKRQGFPTVAAAKGTQLGENYECYRKRVDNLRKKLTAKRLEHAIKDFHESVDVDEVNRQLHGIKPSTVLAPPTIEYELPERALVAQLFSEAADVRDRKALHPLRVKLVSAIAQLCKRRESPCLGPAKRARRSTTKSAEDNIPRRPGVKRCRELDADYAVAGHRRALSTCPFCELCDLSVGPSQRQKLWRLDSLGRHIRTQHLERKDNPFDCPFGDCSETWACAERLVDHIADQHGLYLPPSVVPRRSPRNHRSEGVDELAIRYTTSTVASISANHRFAAAVSIEIQEGPLHLEPTSTPPHLREIMTLPDTRLVCPFCGRDEDVKSLPKHVTDYHNRGKQVPFGCPYEGCLGIIGDIKYFPDHWKRCHPMMN